MSSFSKASFVSDNAEADLNLDDPNFWKKLLGEAAMKNPQIIEESRTRKAVQRYDPGISDESEEDVPEQEPDTDYEHEDDPGTKKKVKTFSPTERQRFKAAMYFVVFVFHLIQRTTYGWNRWEKIKESAKLIRWTISEIESFGKAYLCKCIKFCEAKDLTGLSSVIGVDIVANGYEPGTIITSEKLDLPVTEAIDVDTTKSETAVDSEPSCTTRRFDDIPCLNTSQFEEYMQRNAVKIVNRLVLAAQLANVVHSSAHPFDDINVPETPAPWWGHNEDRDLLIGCGLFSYLP